MKIFTELFEKRLLPGGVMPDGMCFCGLFDSGKAYFTYELACHTGKKMLFVAKSELSARKLYDDMCFLMGQEHVLLVEPAEYMLYDSFPSRNGTSMGRTAALLKIIEEQYSVAIVSPGVLMERLPDQRRLEASVLTVEKEKEYDPMWLVVKLANMGYIRTPKTEEQGQFALRGDILDIFPYGGEAPVRIEFFGEMPETIKYFDPVSQRTTEETDRVRILPDRETLIFDKAAAERVKTEMMASADKCRNPGLKRRVYSDAERTEPGAVFRGSDRYVYFNVGQGKSILEYAEGAQVIFEEPEEIRTAMQTVMDDHVRICNSINETGGLLKETYAIYRSPEDAEEGARNVSGIFYRQFGNGEENPGKTEIIAQKEILSLSDGEKTNEVYLASLAAGGRKVIYYTDTDGRAARLGELLKDAGASVCKNPEQLTEGMILVKKGGLSSSFEFTDSGLCIISENSLSGVTLKRGSRKLKKGGATALTFADLNIGDIVVHDVHGIGKYDGIQSIVSDGVRGDYIKIIYRDNGVVYVPAHRLSEISKYVGRDSEAPILNKLGGKEWSKMTSKVKESLKVYAKELVELYAKRSLLKGFAFSPDTLWQKDFENEFAYDETEDQLKCTAEIKADMELPRPMDRLLCGDVGYGKTEVALRAAFKAICDSKQVIFLVPTTVLALQHYKTFTERFKNFPVKVACMSRMNSEREKKKTADNLKKGYIDVLVGTHSIIKRNLIFKDPGLLVIDEEQRFGVKQKEKIKELYPNIDILTLSATPIPRTLHMSLSGIRDISIIEDPPAERVPVKTYVAEWEPAMVKNAIYREMGRHGQVFYLHNNVETINDKMLELHELVPEARICIGNGQMDEHDLEDVLNDFIEGKYDILLCTTIIESGVDMPNVNTVIVENGDRFGLSQLYQIRGRVGRSDRTAYAYFTYPQGKSLTEVAEKRLRTIRENTEFGAGFKIAMKDLEIRGAGSVLGEKQHGQIAVVGYDMYCRLLNEVVAEEQTGKAVNVKKTSSNVDLKISAFIPESYIEDEESRIGEYRRISSIESEDDINDTTDSLEERYGKIPEETSSLIQISYIRYLAENKNVASVVKKGDYVFLMLDESATSSQLSALGNTAVKLFGKRVSVGIGKQPYVSLKSSDLTKKEVMDCIKQILK